MAAPRVFGVDQARIARVQSMKSPGERIRGLRDAHQMDVGRHQTVAEQIQAISLGILLQQVEIAYSVLMTEEDVTSAIAPLGHVVWDSLDHGTSGPRHALSFDADAFIPSQKCSLPLWKHDSHDRNWTEP